MRIFFTGGSGKAGRHVAPYLAEQGHQVTNADLVPLDHPDVDDLRVDLTDGGEVYSALAGLARFDELDLPEKPSYDAVVHFAAVPAILRVPDSATYATNVLSTYHVLEAATRLGIPKVVFASSETTYGVCFAQGERRPLYVPVDEEHPTVPEDSYAMSKVAGEVTARSFQARTGADVYGLRINNVIEPHEYEELFPAFLEDPALRRRNIFAYIDVRDLGQMVQRCLETDGLGYEVFNVANADMSVAATTAEVIERFYDGVEVRREMGADETFYAIDKARSLVGFEPEHSWREVLGRPVPPEPEEPRVPVTYEQHAHVSGPFLHGTKAELQPGDELVAGFSSNFQEGRTMNHIYFTTLESTAAWGAQLAAALAGLDSRGHVYAVEPLGPFEDDPNVTDKRFPGNPTASYRTRHALRVLHEVEDWEAHPPEALTAMLESLAALRAQGLDVIED